MQLRIAPVALLAAACGAPRAEPSAAPVVQVPPADGDPEGAAALPEREAPAPEPEPDPFRAYVGTWDGLVNGSVATELEIEASGRFQVRASATPSRSACELTGRFRAADEVIWLDVERSSCSVVAPGETLERSVLSRSDDRFTVQSPDGMLVIRYTRR